MNPLVLIGGRLPSLLSLVFLLIFIGLLNLVSRIFDPYSAWSVSSIYFFLAVVVIIPRLIQLDPPASSDGFLLTRPVDHRKLFATKAILLCALGVGIPVGIEFTALIVGGLPVLSLPGALLYLLLHAFAFFLPFVVCAVLTKKYSDYLVVTATLLLLGFTIEATREAFGAWQLQAYYLAPPLSLAQSLAKRDALLECIIYGIISITASFVLHRSYRRTSQRPVGGILAVGFVALLVVEVLRVLSFNQASLNEVPLTKRDVIPQNPSATIRTLVTKRGSTGAPLNRDDKTPDPREIAITIPLKADAEGMIPFLLRFKNLSIVDDVGRSFEINAIDQGTLPCIEIEALRPVLEKRRGKGVTFSHSSPCSLGRNYPLPKEGVFNGPSIKRISGTLWGFDLHIPIDLAVSFKNGVALPSLRGPIVNASTSTSFRSSRERSVLREGIFLPTMLSTPLFDSREGTPLFGHWYASPKTYLLVNNKTGEAIRYSAPPERWRSSSSSGMGLNDLYLYRDWGSDQEGDIPFSMKEDSVLYRMTPHIIGSFTAHLSLTDVPVEKSIVLHSEESDR